MRAALLVFLLASACRPRATPPPVLSNRPAPSAPLAAAPDSPGIVTVAGAGETFQRAIRLAQAGDRLAAMNELWKVVQGEAGEPDEIRDVAAYDLGTLCLEHGFYTHAVFYYDLLVERGAAPELLVRVATGVGVIAERLGETTLPLAATLAKIPAELAARAAPAVKPHLERLPARGDHLGTASDLSRVAHELAMLARTDRAFRTTALAAELLQELVVHQSLLEAECAKQNCTQTKWQPRELPRPVPVRTIAPAPT